METDWRKHLRILTGWPEEIVEAIRSKEEADIYREAGLEYKEVAGRPALVNPAVARMACRRNCTEENMKGKVADPKEWVGVSNVRLMSEGYPPRDKRGEPCELHLIGNREDAPFAELTWRQNRCEEDASVLHPRDIHVNQHDAELRHRKAEHWIARHFDFLEEEVPRRKSVGYVRHALLTDLGARKAAVGAAAASSVAVAAASAGTPVDAERDRPDKRRREPSWIWAPCLLLLAAVIGLGSWLYFRDRDYIQGSAAATAQARDNAYGNIRAGVDAAGRKTIYVARGGAVQSAGVLSASDAAGNAAQGSAAVSGLSERTVGTSREFADVYAANVTALRKARGDKAVDGVAVIPEANLRFDLNSSALTADEKRLLREYAEAYEAQGETGRILVEGYACNIGNDDVNELLSHERAISVRNELVADGVPASDIDMKWYGKSHNSDFGYSDNSANRHVTVSVI